jgi:hypothetical protein
MNLLIGQTVSTLLEKHGICQVQEILVCDRMVGILLPRSVLFVCLLLQRSHVTFHHIVNLLGYGLTKTGQHVSNLLQLCML